MNRIDSNNNSKNSGRKGIFNSLSLSLYDDPRAVFGYNPLRFFCMGCGKEHRKKGLSKVWFNGSKSWIKNIQEN
jgi:hypothetical protein